MYNNGPENYTEEVAGECGKCGEPLVKVLNSDRTMWRNGDRYYYPAENETAYCVFRCQSCHEPVHLTFTPNRADTEIGSPRK